MSTQRLAPPCVLVVEDDASIRSFVAMALEDMAIDLVLCASVSDALSALALMPAAMVITDLMLPGESGLVLVERLVSDRRLCPSGKVVVFSAGVSSTLRASLDVLGVHAVLHKPVPVANLRRCVAEVLPDGPGATPVDSAPAAASAVDTAARERAIAQHFGGDATLHDAFLAVCRQQFLNDIEQGDQAASSGELHALRRLLHSLKTVLATLGHGQASEQARTAEAAAAAGERETCLRLWAEVRKVLLQEGA